jgi:hypothetical protein
MLAPRSLGATLGRRELHACTHAKAKAEPGYRFYALYDKISREDILAHAYAQCRSNKGAPGVDRQDFEAVEACHRVFYAAHSTSWLEFQREGSVASARTP